MNYRCPCAICGRVRRTWMFVEIGIYAMVGIGGLVALAVLR